MNNALNHSPMGAVTQVPNSALIKNEHFLSEALSGRCVLPSDKGLWGKHMYRPVLVAE